MKVLVFLTMLSIALSGPALRTMQTSTFTSSLDIIKGILQGIRSDTPVDDIQSCITNIEAMIPDLSTAMVDYKTHTQEGVKSALMLMSLALKQLPVAITQCQKGHDEAAAIIDSANKAFSSPWSLIVNFGRAIILNGKEINTELSAASTAWENHNMHAFGFSIGQIMHTVHKTADLAASSNPNVEGSVEFIEGVLTGLGSEIELEQIKTCINEIKSIGNEIEAAFSDIKTETLEGAIQGFAGLGKSLNAIHTAVTDCKQESTKTADSIKSAAAQFSEPFTFAYHVGKAILINDKQIYNEITTAIHDWRNAEWFNSGVNIGKAMEILVGSTQTENVSAVGIRMIKQ